MISLMVLAIWLLLLGRAKAFTVTYSNVDQIMKWTEVFPNRFVKDILSDDNQHTLALLRWKNPTESYDLIIRTHTFDNRSYTRICDVSSPFDKDSEWVVAESITLLKSNQSVLIYWKEIQKIKGNRMKLQIILSDNCRSSEYIYVKATSDGATDYKIVKFEHTFDVIFHEKIPRPRYVKLAFDFYGKPLIDKPEAIFLESNDGLGLLSIENAYAMNFNKKEDYALVGKKADFRRTTYKDVYSPISGWLTAGGNHPSTRYVYSNSSGYATICWTTYRSYEIRCKRLDEIPSFSDELFAIVRVDEWINFGAFSIHNKPNGELLLLYGGFDGRRQFILVDTVLTYGKCRRLAKILIPHPLHRLQVSFVDDNVFCLSYVARARDSSYTDVYEFASGCFQEYFFEETITCGDPRIPRVPNPAAFVYGF